MSEANILKHKICTNREHEVNCLSELFDFMEENGDVQDLLQQFYEESFIPYYNLLRNTMLNDPNRQISNVRT